MNTEAANLKTPHSPHCPCGSSKQYSDCCGRYLDHGEVATTAEHLMRSRYTAYTLNREDYLLWQPGITALVPTRSN